VLVIQLLVKPIPDVVPNVAGSGIVFEVLHPLVEDLAVPFRHGNAFGRCRDSVPQRLYVVDLFVHRQIVKTGWWQRYRFRHGAR